MKFRLCVWENTHTQHDIRLVCSFFNRKIGMFNILLCYRLKMESKWKKNYPFSGWKRPFWQMNSFSWEREREKIVEIPTGCKHTQSRSKSFKKMLYSKEHTFILIIGWKRKSKGSFFFFKMLVNICKYLFDLVHVPVVVTKK